MMPARSDPGDSAPARLRDAWRGFTERALPADWIEAYTHERHVLIAGDAPIFIVNHHSDVGSMHRSFGSMPKASPTWWPVCRQTISAPRVSDGSSQR